MSAQNFQELTEDLNKQIDNINALLDSLRQEIVEQDVAFVLRKNDIQKEAGSLLRGHEPSGLGLYLPLELDFDFKLEEITQILNNTFKI
jgi:hypothetical protein